MLPTTAAAEPPARKPTSEAQAGVDPYTGHIAEAARRFGLPAPWIRAVMHAESGGDRRAVSSAGAMGLMQIMPATWAELRARYGLGSDPFDPHDNILAGTAYLRELHERFSVPGFLAAYNAGPSRYADHLATGRPLPAETRAFVAALAPATTAAGTADAQPREAVGRNGWTRAPLFIAHDRHSATVVSAHADAPSDGTSTTRTSRMLDAITPRASGLFVSPSTRERRR